MSFLTEEDACQWAEHAGYTQTSYNGSFGITYERCYGSRRTLNVFRADDGRWYVETVKGVRR